jgi:dGTPase
MNIYTQEDRQKHAEDGLAVYATRASQSRGRLVVEKPPATRTEFQRDRDRVIHSGAFRKLRNKTQVFIENEGDYYRTRLTHSMEVAQIARSIARVLCLNEDLAEAIALAHDLGHTCFGHAGEDILAEEMAAYGGFDHNDQTFRIVTYLERGYAAFDGLNLTWEALEGIAKHNGPILPMAENEILPPTISAFNAKWDLELFGFAGPEAQIAAIADDVAYNTHDMDDGFRAGFFTLDDIAELPLFGATLKAAQKRFPNADNARLMHETVRDVLGQMVDDVLMTMKANLKALDPNSVTDIRQAKAAVARFSKQMEADVDVVRVFLKTNMYRHESVNRVRAEAKQTVEDNFRFLMKHPHALPNDWFDSLRTHEQDENFKARLICDYIAGMTDPFAVQERRRFLLEQNEPAFLQPVR